MTKICKTCGDEKPIINFRKERTNADGYQSFCKRCQDTKQYGVKICKECGEELTGNFFRVKYKGGSERGDICKDCLQLVDKRYSEFRKDRERPKVRLKPIPDRLTDKNNLSNDDEGFLSSFVAELIHYKDVKTAIYEYCRVTGKEYEAVKKRLCNLHKLGHVKRELAAIKEYQESHIVGSVNSLEMRIYYDREG